MYSISAPARQRHTFSRGEGGPPALCAETAGRKRNAGDTVGYGKMLRLAEIQPSSRSETVFFPSDFRPHSSSVTAIGSEVPIAVTASPRGKLRALPRQYIVPSAQTHKYPAGWYSAQRIKISMIADGNHTLIQISPPYNV